VGAPLEQVQETGKQGRKPLLAADLLTRIKSASVPPTVAHLGGFLSRQQMRREQAYQAFRQHWTRLEQEQFHKLFLIYIQE
jgi:hypothetical protein